MFCGEVNEKFIKQGFEMHYWKSCPMLKQCNDCKQVKKRKETSGFSFYFIKSEYKKKSLTDKVIEISVQNEHLLTECQSKASYKKCPRCGEAVNTTNQQENEHHFKHKQCAPFEKKSNRCPLCHTNIGLGEETWKEHLMSPNGCAKNTRKQSHHAASLESSKKANHQRK
jgi:centrosomal protein CEP104